MKIITKIKEMQQLSLQEKNSGNKISVIPTMGYLHKGHLSLVEKAKNFSEITIVTLFVNPTQFAPNEDYSKYPRDFKRDVELCEKAGVNYLFMPDALEMYPIGFSAKINIGRVTEDFEGKFRPQHFEGVATIVVKLLNSTLPNFAVFGQKDYQQSLLVKKIVTDLNFPLDIIVAPTLRESDGLAMSSRNVYLSDEDRPDASILFVSLEKARNSIENGERNRKIINAIMHKTLRSVKNLRIDYASSALADTLESPDEFLPGETIVLLLAVYLGKTRLIDNTILKIPSILKSNTSAFEEFKA
jgi:pantoate--beta-alanine ligase